MSGRDADAPRADSARSGSPFGDRAARFSEGVSGARRVLFDAARRSAAEARSARSFVFEMDGPGRGPSIQSILEGFAEGFRSQSFVAAWATFAVGERLGRTAFGAFLPRNLPGPRLPSARALAIATVAADVASGYASIERRKRWYPNLVGDKDYASWDRRGAELVREAAETLGGSLIKAGQFASSRPDLLPAPYVRELSKLQDSVPPRPFAVIRRAVEKETGRALSETFRFFDPGAVAAASIAQVHRATLHDGREVAVKVRYPEVAGMVEEDLSSLEAVFDVVNLARREVRLQPISDYLRWTLPIELDLAREGRAMNELREALKDRDDVVVPEPVPGLSSEGLLVMEYVEGVRINDVEALEGAKIDRTAVAELLNDAFADQLFRRGIFHADPHPGNLRVLPGPEPRKPKLLLYDHGLTLRLEPEFVAVLAKMVVALRDGDLEALGDALGEAGLPVGRDTDLDILLQLVGVMLGPDEDEGDEEADDGAPTFDLGGGVMRLGAGIGDLPPRLLLVGRAIAFLDSITRQLDEDVVALDIVARYTEGSPREAG